MWMPMSLCDIYICLMFTPFKWLAGCRSSHNSSFKLKQTIWWAEFYNNNNYYYYSGEIISVFTLFSQIFIYLCSIIFEHQLLKQMQYRPPLAFFHFMKYKRDAKKTSLNIKFAPRNNWVSVNWWVAEQKWQVVTRVWRAYRTKNFRSPPEIVLHFIDRKLLLIQYGSVACRDVINNIKHKKVIQKSTDEIMFKEKH